MANALGTQYSQIEQGHKGLCYLCKARENAGGESHTFPPDNSSESLRLHESSDEKTFLQAIWPNLHE